MRKMIVAALAALVVTFGISPQADAQAPPFWQIYWFGYTGGNCGGSQILIFDFETLENLWNQGAIVSYRAVVYGKVRHCQWETPDEEENTH